MNPFEKLATPLFLLAEDFNHSSNVKEKIASIKENPRRSIDSLSEDAKREYDEFISGEGSNIPYYALAHNPPTKNHKYLPI